jgi:LuxR family maltose regulon positive regulatory protein
LLVAKLHPPRLPSRLIRREHLLRRLDGVLDHPLTLVVAPAGLGKTTVLSQWLADRTNGDHMPPVSWLTLDAADNDPVRFWRYLIAACQAIRPDVGHIALALFTRALQAPFELPSFEAILTMLLNDLTEQSCAGVVVLEDYHVITEPHIHQMLAFWLDHLPATLHVVLLTRAEPPLPLARWRVRGRLLEIQTSDLRFSTEETARFVDEALPFALTPHALQQLDAQLEGWATGLRLVTLALQGYVPESEVEQALATFGGSRRQLLDYFISEVLETQAKPLQHFLLRTSILTRLTGSLCDAVTGRADSDRLLEVVAGAGLFLQPLDRAGHWYRYHTLFAEAMQREACRRLGVDAVRVCYERACDWYEQHAMLAEAIEAALAGERFTRAAGLIEQTAAQRSFTEHDEVHTVRRWLDHLPEGLIHDAPALCFAYANALVFTATSDQLSAELRARVETLLQRAEQGWRDGGDTARLGDLLAFRALLTVRQGAIAEAARLAAAALAALPQEQAYSASRVIATTILGEAARQAGELNTAWQRLMEARALSEAAGNRPGTRVIMLALGDVCVGRAALHRAANYYQQVLAAATDDLTDRTRALLGLAQVAYEWNDLEAAWRQAQEVLELARQLMDEALEVQATLLEAQVLHAGGAREHARQMVDALLQRMPLSHGAHERDILHCQARFRLAAGALTADVRQESWLVPADAPTMLQQERVGLLDARWLLGHGRAEEALSTLDHWLASAVQGGRVRSALEIQLLMARAHAIREETRQAQQMVRTVLVRAEPEGYMRLFLDEGAWLAQLVRELPLETDNRRLKQYRETLLQVFARDNGDRLVPDLAVADPLAEPLTTQEHRVLSLLAAGCSRREIAEELVISINTVKTHLQRIYGKLNVRTRAEARTAARRLHLL